MPFDWADNPFLKNRKDRFCVLCPFCNKKAYAQSKDDWHGTLPCAKSEEEKKEYIELLKLGKQNKWQPCPRVTRLLRGKETVTP